MARKGSGTLPISGRFLAGFLLCAIATLAATSSASANMNFGPDFESRDDLLFYLVLTNLPIDLFCFSALTLFMCRVFGGRVGRISNKSPLFLGSVVLASLVIAASGAIIDFYAFYGRDLYGYSVTLGNSEPAYTSLNLYIALLSIFISVFLMSVVVVRTKGTIGLYIAAGMTAVNFAAWMSILAWSSYMEIGVAVLVSTAFWLLANIPLLLLWRWHHSLDLKDATSPQEEQA